MFLPATYRLQLRACVISILLSTMVHIHVFSPYVSMALQCFLNIYSKYFITVSFPKCIPTISLKITLHSLNYFCTLLFYSHICHYLSPRIVKVIYFLYFIFIAFVDFTCCLSSGLFLVQHMCLSRFTFAKELHILGKI